MKNLIFIVVLISGCRFSSFAQTNIPPGNVSGTWGINGSPYNILGDITIPDDSTLIIEPGVLVEFQGYYALNVQGKLLAMGTNINGIQFTINDTSGFHNPDTTLGGWNGIQFIDTPLGNDTSKLIFCTLVYGKAVGSSLPDNSGGAIFISSYNKVLISNCLITNSSAGGSDSPSGGGIGLHFANITLIENEISHNRAWDGGGIQIWESDPVFINNSIISNSADEGGGGVWIGGISNCEFNYDDISHNQAGSNGGGILCWQTTTTNLNSVTINDNYANWGGGIGVIDCEMQMMNCNLNDNSAIGLGGGIGSDFSNLIINNSTFTRDTSGSQSGGVHSWFSDVQISQSTFTENQSDFGGAIHAEYSSLQIDTSSFVGNTARIGGGALDLFNCNLEIDSCLLKSNTALSNSGAVNYLADSLIFGSLYLVDFSNSRIENNSAVTFVGGINIEQTTSESSLIDLTIDKCKISGNTAHHVAGARILRCPSNVLVSNSIINNNIAEAWVGGMNIINNSNGDVINCLFYDNHAATVTPNSTTGGLGVSSSSKVNVFNCTFANNISGLGGGLQLYRGGDAVVTNNIFWGNYPDQIALAAVVDTLPCTIHLNYNDIQFGTDSIKIDDTVSVVYWGTGNITDDPLFKDTLNNDFHLQDLSPCIAAGIDSIEIEGFWYYAPVTDIEGNPRPNPAGTMPDMGAFESEYSVGIDEQNLQLPTKYILFQNYPNPFNPSTKIKFTIPSNVILSEAKNLVTLKIYDVLGNEVATMVNEEKPTGEYEVTFDAVGTRRDLSLTSGIYFYQLKAGNFIQTKKMVLIK